MGDGQMLASAAAYGNSCQRCDCRLAEGYSLKFGSCMPHLIWPASIRWPEQMYVASCTASRLLYHAVWGCMHRLHCSPNGSHADSVLHPHREGSSGITWVGPS